VGVSILAVTPELYEHVAVIQFVLVERNQFGQVTHHAIVIYMHHKHEDVLADPHIEHTQVCGTDAEP
jgi:hypothetical protein